MRLSRLAVAALMVLLGTVSDSAPPKEVGKQNSEVVFITKTGKKFHQVGCRSLARSSIKTTRAEALAKGLQPCHVCKP
jgi:hypothetical protein